ncbi:MAG TPA: HAD hydrolase family protein [Solirubrobacteraceae bacterium]
MGEPAFYPVVVFDLDGTLLRGTTVSLLLAQWLGQTEEIAELERAFHAHEISNSVVADTSAGWLAGQSTADAWLLSGKVTRYFDEHDKARFVEDWCAQNGFSMSQVAAVGDSRSDVPLFRRAGTSIALNATPDAREAATHTLDTDDLCDVLALLQPVSDDRTAE